MTHFIAHLTARLTGYPYPNRLLDRIGRQVASHDLLALLGFGGYFVDERGLGEKSRKRVG